MSAEPAVSTGVARVVMLRVTAKVNDDTPMVDWISKVKSALSAGVDDLGIVTVINEEYLVDGERVKVADWEAAVDVARSEEPDVD